MFADLSPATGDSSQVPGRRGQGCAVLGVATGCSQVKPVSKQTQTAKALHLRFRRDTKQNSYRREG